MGKQTLETVEDINNWMDVVSKGYDVLLTQSKMKKVDESFSKTMYKLVQWVQSEINEKIKQSEIDERIKASQECWVGAFDQRQAIPTRFEYRKPWVDDQWIVEKALGTLDGFILTNNPDEVNTDPHSCVEILIPDTKDKMPDLDDIILFCYDGCIYCGYVRYYTDDDAHKFINVESIESSRVRVYNIEMKKLSLEYIREAAYTWKPHNISYGITVAHNIVHEQRNEIVKGYIDPSAYQTPDHEVVEIYVPAYKIDVPGFRVSGPRDYITFCDYMSPEYATFLVESVEECRMCPSNVFRFGTDYADIYVFHCKRYVGDDVIFR